MVALKHLNKISIWSKQLLSCLCLISTWDVGILGCSNIPWKRKMRLDSRFGNCLPLKRLWISPNIKLINLNCRPASESRGSFAIWLIQTKQIERETSGECFGTKLAESRLTISVILLISKCKWDLIGFYPVYWEVHSD